MAYATPSDVATELGRPASSTAESDQWQAWLDRVERSIARRFTRLGYSLAGQIAAGVLTADDVADVEVAAVLRRVEAPKGPTSITTSVDDGSVTKHWDTVDDAASLLDLTDDEWAALLPAAAFGDAFSTRPGFDADTAQYAPAADWPGGAGCWS